MPTLQDYLGVSRTGDQNSRIKGSLDQLPSKNYNLVSICSKISKSSGFYACITVSGFIFLRDAHCLLQTKKEEKFLV